MNLQKILKNLKLNEGTISTFLGAIVVVVVGLLVVNYYKAERGQNLTGLSTDTIGKGEHIVVKGETLWSIAENAYGSGYNWTDVKTANKLTSDKIEVGQKLNLPEVIAKNPTATKVADKTTVSITSETYTVVKGDTLWSISVRAYGDGYKWSQIAKANALKNPNLIHAGNVLTLPR